MKVIGKEYTGYIWWLLENMLHYAGLEGSSVDSWPPTSCTTTHEKVRPPLDMIPLLFPLELRWLFYQYEALKVTTERIDPPPGPLAGDSLAVQRQSTSRFENNWEKNNNKNNNIQYTRSDHLKKEIFWQLQKSSSQTAGGWNQQIQAEWWFWKLQQDQRELATLFGLDLISAQNFSFKQLTGASRTLECFGNWSASQTKGHDVSH